MDEPAPAPVRLRLRKGVILDDPPADARALHLARMRAAAPNMGPNSYFTLTSAAVAHGLPLWGDDLERVRLVYTTGGHGQVRSVTHAHKTPLVTPATTHVDGLRMTTLGRTAGDLMRRVTFGPALSIADAALRLGASRTELMAEVRSGRGCRIATEAIRRADARSESPYESLARALMLQNGIPLPELQVEFRDEQGNFVARSDFAWRRKRLIGEFDGEVKVTELLLPGESRDDVLRARARRDDRLRGLGQRVLHWDAQDIHDVTPFLASIRNHLGDVYVDHGLCPEAMGYRRRRTEGRNNPSPRRQ